jgi:ABC-type dipeptide/oligopeptide/nickel transport system permease subunit
MSKFTPGPWNRYGIIGKSDGLNKVRSSAGTDRVGRDVFVDIPATGHDARLIAAAPEMYALLKGVAYPYLSGTTQDLLKVEAIKLLERIDG